MNTQMATTSQLRRKNESSGVFAEHTTADVECGALVHVEGGKVVKVKLDADSPMSKGWLCIKRISTPEIANHKYRSRYTLRYSREEG